jgi:hypothetical protein
VGEFKKYVIEISRVQRQNITDRVEHLANHRKRASEYFIGCMVGSVVAISGVFALWGPRHIFKSKVYFSRPIAPALSVGLVLYAMVFVMRDMVIRNRISVLIDDYEYELRRVKGHHVPEGIEQLAWLQFVMEQLKYSNENKLDFEKMRSL